NEVSEGSNEGNNWGQSACFDINSNADLIMTATSASPDQPAAAGEPFTELLTPWPAGGPHDDWSDNNAASGKQNREHQT
ncbi:MAG: hypothetical protein AAB385_07310, partial [Planctomycetota bacterium]